MGVGGVGGGSGGRGGGCESDVRGTTAGSDNTQQQFAAGAQWPGASEECRVGRSSFKGRVDLVSRV